LKVLAAVVAVLHLVACSGGEDLGSELSAPTLIAPTTTSLVTTGPPPSSTVSSIPTTTTPPATTSTSSSTTAVTLGEVPQGTIGVVGCSVTSDGVVGYFNVGGSRFWNIRGDYGGASVGMWARGGGMWEEFDTNLLEHPDTRLLWWQLCTLNGSPRDGLESAAIVLEGLLDRIPGATIYVSAQPDYEPAGICGISGRNGPAFMAEVAAALVGQFGLQPGPVVGPLTESDTVGGCHASESGQILMGEQLLAAFG
jgi:hypothetical protein